MLKRLDEIRFFALDKLSPPDVPRPWVDKTVAEAEKLLKHRYNYFALGETDLGENINWNREYKRGINTPLKFGPWMDYRCVESFGDFKYFWEVPRLQHLITLAKAYYLTGEKKYADEVMNQLSDFVTRCPYLRGVNWIMPMESGIRLISICWIVGFLKTFFHDEPRHLKIIEHIVKSHIHFIVNNYAAYSSANNHLIGEASAVFITCLCFKLVTN